MGWHLCETWWKQGAPCPFRAFEDENVESDEEPHESDWEPVVPESPLWKPEEIAVAKQTELYADVIAKVVNIEKRHVSENYVWAVSPDRHLPL